MKKILTLCIVQQGSRVLLGMKKRGFGAGRWNGFGGKVEEGEITDVAARRELKEEVGLVSINMIRAGIITFSFDSEPTIREVHVFRVTDFSGVPRESEEMRPEWFESTEIPLAAMWPSDRIWLPVLLKGKPFRGTFHYDRPSTASHSGKILSHSLELVEQMQLEKPQAE